MFSNYPKQRRRHTICVKIIITQKVPKGKHLTYDHRKLIAHLYNYQNKNYTEIAEELNCYRTTISREIKKGLFKHKRGSGQDDVTDYDFDIAQREYDINATAKGPELKIDKNHKLAKFIEKKANEKYSPEVIAHLIDKSDEFVMSLSYKAIYNNIDKGILMMDREELVFGNYRDKSKKQRNESSKTTRHKKGKTIRDRPKAADKRSEIGYFEMDLVEGQKDSEEPNLLVLTDRKTRKEIIEKTHSKT